METNEKLKKLSLELVENSDDWMANLRDNISMYISQKNISLKELAEISGVTYETFKTFLYGSGNNCKLSVVVNLAKALNVSIDELLGLNTVNTTLIKQLRNLPTYSQAYCEWSINQLYNSYNKCKADKTIVMMTPNVDDAGVLHPSHNNTLVDMSDLPDSTLGRILMAIEIPNKDHMPYYPPGVAILVANDRLPRNNEHVLMIISGCMWIFKTVYENNTVNYYSIRDNKFRYGSDYSENIVGYIAGFHEL